MSPSIKGELVIDDKIVNSRFRRDVFMVKKCVIAFGVTSRFYLEGFIISGIPVLKNFVYSLLSIRKRFVRFIDPFSIRFSMKGYI